MSGNAVAIGNGDTGYITSTSGTITSYIPQANLTVAEESFIDSLYPNKTAGVLAPVISAAGSGYVNPVLTFTGGTSTVAATGYVTLNGSGGIASVVITNPGVYTVLPTGATVTGSPGTGCVLAAPTATTDLQDYLTGSLWTNGQNGWTHFGGYALKYNSAGDDAFINGADVPAAGAAFSQSELQDVVNVVNALKHVVAKNLGHTLNLSGTP